MVMTSESLFQSPLWEQFEQEARQRRRNPASLLARYMRECLEIWEDQELDEEIQQDVQRSGYSEEDAVEIVRRHRKGKRGRRDAS
jgi:hypothetical protein